MRDQAENLREMMRSKPQSRALGLADSIRVLTITSGKGGVGKTSLAINLAIALQDMGYRVLIIDADFGLGNVDIMLGASPRYNLSHVIFKNISIYDAIIQDPSGIMVLPGGSGLLELANIQSAELNKLLKELEKIEDKVDIAIIDTGAGLSSQNIKMILAANESILVTTPDPTSLMDAYGMVKAVSSMGTKINFNLVMNMVEDIGYANTAMENLKKAGKHFLDVEISKLGLIENNLVISRATRAQSPFILQYPHSRASRQLKNIASSLVKHPYEQEKMSIKSYVNRLFGLFSRK